MMDDVKLLGVRADGSAVVLGAIPEQPAMKRRDIVRNYFGEPSDDMDDFDDATTCLAALIDYHAWLLSQGWKAPELVVTPETKGT